MKPFKMGPYQLWSFGGRPVQTISIPDHDGIVLVRWTPGMATTLESVLIETLDRMEQYPWIHYFHVWTELQFNFPTDMLRYIGPCGRSIDSAHMIGMYRLGRTKNHASQIFPERWASFGYRCVTANIFKLNDLK